MTAMVAIIGSEQALPPARFSTMTIAVVVNEAFDTPGLNGIASGTSPGGATFQAIFGEVPPQVGETWRCVSGEGGMTFLEDLVRGG